MREIVKLDTQFQYSAGEKLAFAQSQPGEVDSKGREFLLLDGKDNKASVWVIILFQSDI